MFRADDTDFVKRTLLVCAAVVIVVAIVVFGIVRTNQQMGQTKRAHYRACLAIKDPTQERDCIAGTRTEQEYPR